MSKIFYKGFSSQLWESGKRTFMSRNKDVVKQDLLNHIFTAKGERVMMPGFGTRIPSLPFEPIDSITLKIVEEDLREVINFDPRVELMDLKVMPLSDNNAILAYVTVKYLELGGVETFNIEIPAGNS